MQPSRLSNAAAVAKYSCIAMLVYYVLEALVARASEFLVNSLGLSPHVSTAVVTWVPVLAWTAILFLTGYAVGRSVHDSKFASVLAAGVVVAVAYIVRYATLVVIVARARALPMTLGTVVCGVLIAGAAICVQVGITVAGGLAARRHRHSGVIRDSEERTTV